MLTVPQLRTQHRLHLSQTHVPAPADRGLMRCLGRACGPVPHPSPLFCPAPQERDIRQQWGWRGVTLALSAPLLERRHWAFPQGLLPPPPHIGPGGGWLEPGDRQRHEGGFCTEEDPWSGWASMGWWGQGERNLPFPEVRVGGGRKAGSEASAETLARVGGSVNCW